MDRVFWVQNLWIEFYGVMVISAFLKKNGHESDIVFDTKEEVVKCIRRYKPDAIAFSCMTVQWKWAQEMSTHIKQSGIKTPIIVGGIHATMYPDNAISHPDVDVVCLNEGEYPMLDFMNALDEGRDYSTIQNLFIRPGQNSWLRDLMPCRLRIGTSTRNMRIFENILSKFSSAPAAVRSSAHSAKSRKSTRCTAASPFTTGIR